MGKNTAIKENIYTIVSPTEENHLRGNNLLVNAQDNNSYQEVVINSKIGEKICNDLIKVQENIFASVDEDCFEDDSLSESVYSEIDNAKKSGAFIPAKGLTLIYGSEEGVRIFAKRVSKGGSIGDPVIVFAYPDGSVSNEIEIKIAELMELSFGNFGEEREGINKDNVKDARKLTKKIGIRVLSFWHPDIDINLVELLKILMQNLSILQVDRGNELDITVVYASIYKYVKKMSSNPHKCYLERRGFYALTREDMLEIVGKLDTTMDEFIRILKQNNVLYLQKSSVGYQCEVKGVGSCYCIRMLSKYKPEMIEDFGGNGYDTL